MIESIDVNLIMGLSNWFYGLSDKQSNYNKKEKEKDDYSFHFT